MSDLREDTACIEVTFGAPVHITREQERRLVDLIGEICDDYEKRHPDRVMWPAGFGGRMLTNPFMVDDEHPMEFDMSVMSIECCERENFDWPEQSA